MAFAPPALGKTIPAQVISITDGDPMVVKLQGRQEKVRRSGIEASECRSNLMAEKDSIRAGADLRTITAISELSTQYVKSVIRPGEPVQIELDRQERDMAACGEMPEMRQVS
jgi:hypothetical protein